MEITNINPHTAVIRGGGRREQGGADQPGAAEASGPRPGRGGSGFPEFRPGGGKFKRQAASGEAAAAAADAAAVREDLLRGRVDQVGAGGRHDVGLDGAGHPRGEEPRPVGAALGNRRAHPGALHGEVQASLASF